MKRLQYFLFPFRLVYKIYYLVIFCLTLVIFYPVFYYLLSDSRRFPKAFIVMRWYALLWQFLAFAPIRVKGYANIRKAGSCIICPNHSSFMDIPCLYIIFKDYFVFTGKKEIEKWPLFHIFYTSGMNILVDSHSRRKEDLERSYYSCR